MSRHIGNGAEQQAISFLKQNQLEIINHNFYSRFGEIDLIGLDGCSLVFIEVKYRKNNHFGSASELVTRTKKNTTDYQVFPTEKSNIL